MVTTLTKLAHKNGQGALLLLILSAIILILELLSGTNAFADKDDLKI